MLSSLARADPLVATGTDHSHSALEDAPAQRSHDFRGTAKCSAQTLHLMIISHANRFVFIKTRKTAGSSVEIALSRICGPQDVITPLSAQRGEERLRREERGIGPINHLKPIASHRGFKEWRRLLLKASRSPYPEHATVPEVQAILGRRLWDQYFSFTIERNPWDRALSRYWWQKHRWEEKGRTGFPCVSDYLHWLARNKPHWLSNWNHYAIGDRIAVDRVLRYEALETELADLQNKLTLTGDLQLPARRAKSGFRDDNRHYSQLLTDADRSLIARLCHREIEAFGYTFD